MSDLSQLLDDLYEMTGSNTQEAEPATPAPAPSPKAPEWASEEALDEAFAEWVPGPADDAGATERSLVAAVVDQPAVEVPSNDDWLFETEPERSDVDAVDVLGHVEHEPVAPAPATMPCAALWTPGDDDILPRRGPRVSSRRRAKR